MRLIKRKRIQFFASYSKKKDSILCVIFHSLRHIQNKGSILCVILEKQGHFFESWKKVGSTLLSQFEKNLCVILKKIYFFESCKRKLKWKRGSILWDILRKQRVSILCQMKKNFMSLSHIEKRFIKRVSILWVILKKFNYLTLFEKVKSEKKGPILWVAFVFQKKTCESFSKKGSILRVIYQMGSIHSDVLKRGFNSLSHIFLQMVWFFRVFQKGHFLYFSTKVQFFKLRSKKWVRFFESFSKRLFDSVSYIQKINSWSHFYFSKHSLSLFCKKVQFSES